MLAILQFAMKYVVTPVSVCYIINCLTKIYAIHQIVYNPKMSNDKAKSISKIVRTDFTKFHF